MIKKYKYGLENIDLASKLIVDHIKNYNIFLLEGDLGSGKTTLIKNILRNIGILENINSPTFSIVNNYIQDDLEVYHFDLYRVKNVDDLYTFGFYEYLESRKLCFIEWPQRILKNFDYKHLYIKINTLENNERELHISKN
ncbi:MAG: tRNA (adenosine(37)-N6)-threonylcarbamoyltransferase complex ATPase subunit type 1 TsaE [Flavobacteriaceae bacterium]|nr:tRNA (adenosine(37)-N6)-threonylcarbamoyltransferase complex ATPase subunit type 1 TsaE [Flavobacteriaceae bacterium]|tara:strand:+ start:25413 stop:25832 length:420 start_codon:yes stop_codon:yes gene_type:complete